MSGRLLPRINYNDIFVHANKSLQIVAQHLHKLIGLRTESLPYPFHTPSIFVISVMTSVLLLLFANDTITNIFMVAYPSVTYLTSRDDIIKNRIAQYYVLASIVGIAGWVSQWYSDTQAIRFLRNLTCYFLMRHDFVFTYRIFDMFVKPIPPQDIKS